MRILLRGYGQDRPEAHTVMEGTLLPRFIYWPQRIAGELWERYTEGVLNPATYRSWSRIITTYFSLFVVLAGHAGCVVSEETEKIMAPWVSAGYVVMGVLILFTAGFNVGEEWAERRRGR